MHFATYLNNGQECAGVFYSGGYYSFRELLGEDITMLDFIRRCEEKEIPDFSAIISAVPAEGVVLQAPIPRPFRNIICLGKNYEDHAKEIFKEIPAKENENLIPTAPIFFTKAACPASADGSKIPLHKHFTKQVDYEAELAVIIGKTAFRISREEAEGVIFGYTIINDISARDIQTQHAQWFFGKSLDGFCPMGPHIVSRDEINPANLKIQCRVNGKTRQSSNTSKLIFDIPEIVSTLSQGITLFPGDIIATGTPAGIGHAMNPPQYLKSGDKVECEIEKIGILTNYF